MGWARKVSCLRENDPSKDLRLMKYMQERGTAVWSASSVWDSNKSLLEEGLVAVHMVSRAFVQEDSDLWNPHPGEACLEPEQATAFLQLWKWLFM